MFRVKIGAKGKVKDSLGKVVADIGGIFCPLILYDIFHKVDAAIRAFKQFFYCPDAFCLNRVTLLAQIYAPFDRRIECDHASAVFPGPALGAYPHQGINNL